MKRYIAEAIGTFALVFCGTGAIVINEYTNGAVTHPGIAVTFGLIVMAMIYAFGDISGAHINPAVTIAFAYAKKFPWKEVFPYVIAQLTGACVASALICFLFPESETMGATLPQMELLKTGVLELILTFFLMLVIINVSTGSKEIGVIAGIAIGGVVLLEAMFAGPVTGASMNPARSIAPALFSQNFTGLWIYIIAPVMGALLAVMSCRLVKDDDCCDTNC
ncbi:MIP/aquaporin family protein [Constantimarinum furrinae]|uniref:MIP family channel protein n=1 Tax=Constantimarinum furrinae TaxID=2562285 RepID=A0A7G8PW67_9FLAO|nr:MIP family channel protein [Constantimarinum furrinae]QNJ98583.1 MIP family channel protein [Constantimarinum furrinae]